MERIFNWLKQNKYHIWAHTASSAQGGSASGGEGDLRIGPADDFKSVDFSAEVPLDGWKQAFFPSKHTLFEFQPPHSPPISAKRKQGELEGVALFGVRIFDLEAINLYDAVFADDPYYQARRKNILIVGFAPKGERKDTEILFDKTFSAERLSHYTFDIFFDEKNKKYYCGSKLGGEILKKLKTAFIRVMPGGHSISSERKTAFTDSKVWKNYLKWKKVINETLNSKVWDELGKTCLACGKCSIACPTCFCFDIADEFEESGVSRNRCWGNCFYQEFHRVAVNNVFNDNIRDRIAFWYIHKFSRIPKDYKMRGCVGCERCIMVCPVAIDIKKNLKKLEESLKKQKQNS
jgi:sulfhydrogenase subunit beta (sulfur reductase)